jgi:uncharacterized protein (TIGR02118 family)
MIFRSGVFSRREGLASDAFTTHWRETHGALARHLPGLHSYLQNHIVERFHEVVPFPGHAIDGISQLWFDDVAAMERAEASPQYDACKSDIPKFQGAITILVLDSERAFGDETVSEGKPKLLWLCSSSKADDASALRNEWLKLNPGSLSADIPGACRMVQNFVVDRSHPVSAGVPQGNLSPATMTEVWFDSRAALDAWASSGRSREIVSFVPSLEAMAIYGIEEIRIK